MKFRITVICENSVGPLTGAMGEHGFAALVEPSEGTPFLFDTGQGLSLLHNARLMHRDLARVGNVIISHGHYDHGGGLLPLLTEFGSREVYGHPGIFTPRYRVKDTGECYPIGILQSRGVLEAAGARFDLAPGFRELSPGIFLTGEIPRLTTFETGDQGLYRDRAGLEPDITMDDQALVMETARGLVILLGCCHAGLVNTLAHITASMGRQDIYALIGGTHLGFCGQDQLEHTIAAIRGVGIQKLAVSHCTGFAAAARLARELPKLFQLAMVGYTLEV